MMPATSFAADEDFPGHNILLPTLPDKYIGIKFFDALCKLKSAITGLGWNDCRRSGHVWRSIVACPGPAAQCSKTVESTVWLEILAGNLFWRIGSFESNLPKT